MARRDSSAQRPSALRSLVALLVLVALPGGCSADPLAPIDDAFCHGEVDSTPCDDGNACTWDDRCGNGVCLGRHVPDEVVCDDGDLCTAYDHCLAGSCTGLVVDCAHAAGTCEVGVCDAATGACVAEPAATGEVCDDGDACTVGDTCSGGGCTGAARDCSGEDGPCTVGACSSDAGGCVALARPDGTICGPGETCSVDVCDAGQCRSTPKCGYLDTPCRVGSCDEASGACTPIDFPDGAVCDDGSPCTAGEACTAGVCSGGIDLPDATPCDDADPCTDIGLCSAGACLAPDVDCTLLDGPCVAGTCSRDAKGCVAVPLLDGSACDDGDDCTTGTTCEGDVCGGGESSCFCTGRADGTSCDDGSLCTTGDACVEGQCVGTPRDCSEFDTGCIAGLCDEATGVCNAGPQVQGTPCDDGDPCTIGDGCVAGACAGTPVDCSALDGECTLGVCEAVTGACTIGSRPEGTPCDDGDTCTTHDGCSGGACEGGHEICSACDGLTVGAACDDGDACTGESTCTSTANGLACWGAQPDCEDAPCGRAVCDVDTGDCGLVPKAEGAVCEDGDGCTAADRCVAGSCQGTSVDLCGETVDVCEPAPGGTGPATAVPLDGDGVVALAVHTSDDSDWFAVEAEAGATISVSTRAHCEVTLDTVLTLIAPDGDSVLATSDDTEAGTFAVLDDVLVTQTGTHTIRVDVFGAAGDARYLLDAEVSPAAPCTTDGDCACPQKVCVGGACQFSMPAELEPNDEADQATLSVGDSVHGVVSGGADVDVFTVLVGQGEPLKIHTSGPCGAAGDTEIAVFGHAGSDPIAANDDGGPGRYSAIEGLLAPPGDVIHVAVTSPALETTPYILHIDSGWCTVDADCLCADRACSGDATHPGACAPGNPVNEPGAGAPTPELTLGPAPAHGDILPAFEIDAYEVTLAAGAEMVVRAGPFCGSAVHPTVRIFAPGSGTPLAVASPDDGGETYGTFAVTVAGTYRIEVTGHGAQVGGYLLSVEVAP